MSIIGVGIGLGFPRGAGAASPLLAGLASYWAMEEASGDRADSVGSNTLTDNATVGSAAGKVGTGAVFASASSEYLSRASNPTLQLNDKIAFALWFNSAGGAGLLWKQGEYGVYVSAHIDWRVYYDAGASFTSAVLVGATSAGNWQFLFVSFDPDTGILSASVDDGTPVTNTLGGTVTPAGSQFLIGAHAGPALHFDGMVDEVGLWKGRIPSAEEVTLLYNAGAGRSYPFS